METAFTPVASAIGGVLIGLAAVAFMALHGRILGATGILTGAIWPSGARDAWTKRAVLLGMIAAPALVYAVAGAPVIVTETVSTPLLALGGLVVGVGVTLGAGCTSGHGVCGLARFSRRSLVATATFMATTAATVFVLRHVIGG